MGETASAAGGGKRDTTGAASASGFKMASLVAAGMLLSRIAGLLRESIFAHYFGNSDAADAFKAAFRIPNILQNLFGEGVPPPKNTVRIGLPAHGACVARARNSAISACVYSASGQPLTA